SPSPRTRSASSSFTVSSSQESNHVVWAVAPLDVATRRQQIGTRRSARRDVRGVQPAAGRTGSPARVDYLHAAAGQLLLEVHQASGRTRTAEGAVLQCLDATTDPLRVGDTGSAVEVDERPRVGDGPRLCLRVAEFVPRDVTREEDDHRPLVALLPDRG